MCECRYHADTRVNNQGRLQIFWSRPEKPADYEDKDKNGRNQALFLNGVKKSEKWEWTCTFKSHLVARGKAKSHLPHYSCGALSLRPFFRPPSRVYTHLRALNIAPGRVGQQHFCTDLAAIIPYHCQLLSTKRTVISSHAFFLASWDCFRCMCTNRTCQDRLANYISPLQF